ncbi:hypothetical protein Agabi119p4_7097 [Agaricus bisporus var. burnettii]|uniref:Roadblock/LAMTOR2 domain-containing protein n=1 Tax=Agaricus bisporus var. burnettii TaxID=192524 RepID=A0A8H7EYM0_AGABI|nr:hypothetical protein Agabi119p4_7097 [Agaricus bisporus var. burnettii]
MTSKSQTITYTPATTESSASSSPTTSTTQQQQQQQHQQPIIPLPQELEQTLSTLTSHRSVLGYLLIARGGIHSASIIRHSGVVFEGEKGKKYAGVIARIVDNVQSGLEEINAGSGAPGEESSETNDIKFMRIRTKRHEIMISPDERYLLAVLHDPTVT